MFSLFDDHTPESLSRLAQSYTNAGMPIPFDLELQLTELGISAEALAESFEDLANDYY